jgi:ceramide glucosyltransferase
MLVMWLGVMLLLFWIVATLVFSVVALIESRRMIREASARATPSTWPALQILRPCAGLEPDLEENLLSTATARYPGARELFVLVASREDPAYVVAEAVRARAARVAPEVPVHLVVTDIATRHNRKVAQLARAEGLSRAPVVVVIDSDIRVEDATLPALITALEGDARAGAASCPTVDVRLDTLGDRASSALLSSTPHAFYCLGALAERSGGAHVLCGAFIAIRRAVLDELGGFASLERFIGEDFELSRRLHQRGYTIPTAAVPGRITDRGRTFPSVLSRFARWATVTRQQRPHLMLTYPLLLGAGPLLIAVLGAILVWHLPFAGAFIATILFTLAVRLALTLRLRRAYGLSGGPLQAIVPMLLGESLICLGFAAALGRPIVAWRGVRYRVGRGGLIEMLP